MLQPATLAFLSGLAQNNDRSWFEAHKEAYQAGRKDFEQFVEALKQALIALEPALAEQPAKSLIFRVHRDVRFSKDKTPYKAHFSAYYSRGGRKWAGAGYYIQVKPGESQLSGGLWMPEGPLLRAIRQEIDYSFAEWQGLVENKSFKKSFGEISGERLQKLPAGYDAGHPAIHYLKQKSFIFSQPLPDEFFTRPDAVQQAAARFAQLRPVVDFLNRAMEDVENG